MPRMPQTRVIRVNWRTTSVSRPDLSAIRIVHGRWRRAPSGRLASRRDPRVLVGLSVFFWVSRCRVDGVRRSDLRLEGSEQTAMAALVDILGGSFIRLQRIMLLLQCKIIELKRRGLPGQGAQPLRGMCARAAIRPPRWCCRRWQAQPVFLLRQQALDQQHPASTTAPATMPNRKFSRVGVIAASNGPAWRCRRRSARPVRWRGAPPGYRG